MKQLTLDSPPLQHGALGWLELVETSSEQRTERRRDVDLFGPACHRQHLREEKGVPAGRVGNPLPQPRRQSRDQLVGRFGGQRREAKSYGPFGAARDELGSRHADEHDRRSRGEQRHALDELEKRLLAPLDVVEDDDERRLLLEQLPKRPGDLLGGCPPGALADQQPDGGSCGRVRGQGAQLLDHLDHGPVRNALAIREAATAHDPSAQRGERLADQARLSEAGLADDRHELAPLAGDRASPGVADQLDLGLAAHEPAVVRPLRCVLHRQETMRGYRRRSSL